jgi:ubiquinone/menaquinone biosynthesis C-methylase UbiE
MNLWNIKASFYSFSRKPWPLNKILKKETEIIKLLLHQMLIENPKVLDVGCGVGDSMALLNNEWNIVALDNSINMIRKAPSNNQSWVAADVMYLPFHCQKFHLVTCVGVSEYVNDLDSLLQNIFRIMNYKGYLILTTSPKSLFTQMRQVGGSKIYARNAESIVTASAGYFYLEAFYHLFSMDAFLFRAKEKISI